MATSAGYSGTPLAKKLGIQPGMRVVVLNEPEAYRAWLMPLPPGVVFTSRPDAQADIVHSFVVERSVLQTQLTSWRHLLRADGVLWISWPKKASKVPTTITEDTIRELCLPLGWVDVKVCAVSEVWSGLKLVVRKELR